jgi:hypothetical protein
MVAHADPESPMPFISVTRLRLRSMRFVPSFFLHAVPSLRQARAAPGFCDGSLLADRSWTFWTLTLWDEQASMRAYMTSGDHRTAMPRLAGWCDEASVVHWDQEHGDLPSWTEADRRMRAEGRPSKIRNPSPHHADLSFSAPRLALARPVRRRAG